MSATPQTDKAIAEMKQWPRPFLSVSGEGVTYESPIVSLCRRLERERDEARAACPAGDWVASADYDSLHTATSRLLVAVNNLPVLAFAMVQRDWQHACDVTYGRGGIKESF